MSGVYIREEAIALMRRARPAVSLGLGFAFLPRLGQDAAFLTLGAAMLAAALILEIES